MSEDNNRNNNQNQQLPSADINALKMKSANTLSTVSLIAAPASLLLGGVFISTAALVCAIVSLFKIRTIMQTDDQRETYMKMIRNRAITGIIVSVMALALNAYALITVLPMISEMLNGESLEDIMNTLEDVAANGSADTSGNIAPGGTGSDSVFG